MLLIMSIVEERCPECILQKEFQWPNLNTSTVLGSAGGLLKLLHYNVQGGEKSSEVRYPAAQIKEFQIKLDRTPCDQNQKGKLASQIVGQGFPR